MAKKQRIQIKRDEDFSELDEEMDEALQDLEGTNGKVAHLLERYAEEGEAAIARFLGEDEPAPEDEGASSSGSASAESGEAGSGNELHEAEAEKDEAAGPRQKQES